MRTGSRYSWILGTGGLAGLAALALAWAGLADREPPPPAQAAAPRAVAGYGELPMSFEPNVGQSDVAVRYLSRGQGYVLGLTSNAAMLSMTSGSSERAVLKLALVGANPQPAMTAEQAQASVSNYMIGDDPAQYHTDVPNYAAVRYSAVYAGIDWLVYGNPQHLEYDMVVAPQADPSKIRLKLEGAEQLALDGDGNLQVTIKGHTIVQHAPVSYQRIGGRRQPVESRYVLDPARREVAFALGAYDASAELVIDPSLFYSTFLGGNGTDNGYAIAVDSAGNAYIAGDTASSDFPTTTPLQAGSGGGTDAFVTKLNSSGTAKIFSTYLGGSATDTAYAIAVDGSGAVYVAGSTTSSNFPVTAPLQAATGGGADGFITKLSSTGSSRVYSTYLGGSGNDQIRAMALDSANNVLVTGYTDSSNFPVTAALQATNAGGTDAFVAKINPAGSARAYSTYLGGLNNDIGYGIAVDSAGNAYVVGETGSTNFPTTSPVQAANAGGSDAFVTKLNAAGSARVYSTYLGGSDVDQAYAIAVDANGNSYVAGQTASTNFPTAAPLQGSAGGGDAFVTKLSASGGSRVYSTYLGGSGADTAAAIAVDSSGNVTVAGNTNSANFPTKNALQTANPAGLNAFVTRINAPGTVSLYSTTIGGRFSEAAYALAIDSAGSAYITGSTNSDDYPSLNSLQSADYYSGNAFVTKLGEPSAVHFSAAQYVVDESAGTATVTVERDAPFDQPAVVSYSISAGTATSGTDFIVGSGTLNFAAGQTVKTINNVLIVDDAVAESDETINLVLSNPGLSATLGSPNMAVVVINDDDTSTGQAATLSFSSGNYSVSEAAGQAFVTVQRGGSTNAAASVTVATSSGTATVGTDYTGVSTTLSWLAGDSGVKTVTVPIIDNFNENGDKSVGLALSAPSGASLASPSTAVLTIMDDEAGERGLIQFAASQYKVFENAGGALLTFNRVAGSSGQVCALVSTANSSAVAGTDYTATATNVCFNDGDAATKTVIVPIINNSTNTGTRTFLASLGDPLGASLGVPAAVAVVITDDEAPSTAGKISFAAPTFSVSESTANAVLTLYRSDGSNGAVSVTVTTANGTATAGSDYTALNAAVVSWAAGDANPKSINVPITNDTALESGETFTATLGGATGGVTLVSPSSATVTIVDNDTAAPKVAAFSFGAPEYRTVQGVDVAQVTINRTDSAEGAASVQMLRPADPLTPGSEPVVQTIEFADGDASTRVVGIPMAGYNLGMGTQTVPLKLQNAAGGKVDESRGQSTLVVEDGRAKAEDGGSAGGGGALSIGLLLPLAFVGLRRRR